MVAAFPVALVEQWSAAGRSRTTTTSEGSWTKEKSRKKEGEELPEK
jgi:hypothetical protein